MIANVKSKDLSAALDKLGRLPGRDAGLPGNSILKVEADGFTGLRLCRTTMTSLARIVCEGDVEEDGYCVVPYLGLMDALRACDGEDVRLKKVEGFLKIFSGTGEGEVKLWPDKELIPAPPPLNGQSMHLGHDELMDVLKTCAAAAGTDRARPNLIGMAVRAVRGGLQCFGTNGHRIHVARVASMVNPIDQEPGGLRDMGILIPTDGLSCIMSVFKDVETGCNVTFSTGGVQFDNGEVCVRVPVSTDRPPFIDMLLDPSSSIKTKIAREPFLKAVRAVEPTSGDEAVRLFIGKEAVRVVASSSVTVTQRTLPCESTGDAQVTVTGKYLLNMLECTNLATVELGISDKRLFVQEGERDFLIMFRAIGATSPTPTKTRKK